jgi:hypothetical protein
MKIGHFCVIMMLEVEEFDNARVLQGLQTFVFSFKVGDRFLGIPAVSVLNDLACNFLEESVIQHGCLTRRVHGAPTALS